MATTGGGMAQDHFGEAIRDKFFQFLEDFTTANAAYSMSQASGGTAAEEAQQQFYVEQLKAMRESEKTTLYVDWQHLVSVDADLADEMELQYLRMDPFLRKAVQNLVRKYQENYVESEESGEREFWVAFYNLPKKLALRGLKTQQIGRLVEWEGTVTRTSEVRPELYLGTFECLQCRAIVRNVEQQYKYTEPLICPEGSCGNRKHWLLRRDKSTFVDWQRVKVQELSEQVPPGSLPRTMDVIMRNDVVESVRAGDKMVFTGSLVVVPDISAVTAPGERLETRFGGTAGKGGNATESGVTGINALGVRELTYKLCFMACSTSAREHQAGVVNIRSDDDLEPDEILGQFSGRDAEKVLQMKADPLIYERLASSVAPGVYGHENVKRAILLMLFGGVHKQTAEGINLRGDINVAIVGDPSCAKSQLLKYVSGFLPRAIYTSGKSSSAAGLTATVVKESDTNEFCIEAGALMLADNGICCIDEFDKMDVKDQVAIHEAMEQQTISIAKAGIQATLNARTSILAAANPVGGRYDRSKPLKYNVALPPAILSRFDMMHVMVDEPDAVEDRLIASHIVDVHRQRDALTFGRVPYKMDDMQRYIKYARAIKPELSDHAAKVLVEQYKRLRTDDAAPGSATAYRITVRQLEALVRLSEALARVHCSDTILPSYVREATRLVKNSLIAIEPTDVEVDDPEAMAEEDALAAADARPGGDAAAGPSTGEDAGPAPMDTDGPQTTTRVAHGSQATPLTAPEPETAAGADAAGGGRPGQGAAARAGQQPAAGVKVTRKKFEHVKNLLVMKLREREAESQGIVEFGANEVAGMTQHDLVTWYFDFQAERNDELGEMQLEGSTMVEEARVVQLIVAHLVNKESVLVVVEQPEQDSGESDDAYRARRMRDRVLAISPNYSEA